MTYLMRPRDLQNGHVAGVQSTPLHLTGLSTLIGCEVLPVSEAIRDKRYTREQAQKDSYSALRRTHIPVPDMASAVAQRTLAQTKLSGAELGSVAFSSIHETGHQGLWQPAAYLQQQLSAQGALAFGTTFGCNGLAIGAMQAALMRDGLDGPAMLVAADRFQNSGFDRWGSDQGLAYGDAAAALLLSSKPGVAEIRYLAIDYIPELEMMHRSSTPEYPQSSSKWDITRTKKQYIDLHGGKAFFDRLNQALDRLEANVKMFLSAQNISLKAVVTPFVGRSIRATTYDARFNPLAPINTSDFGASIGHTGTSDQFIGLSYLIDSDILKPKQHALLIGAGAGFSLSAMIVRFTAKPSSPILGDA